MNADVNSQWSIILRNTLRESIWKYCSTPATSVTRWEYYWYKLIIIYVNLLIKVSKLYKCLCVRSVCVCPVCLYVCYLFTLKLLNGLELKSNNNQQKKLCFVFIHNIPTIFKIQDILFQQSNFICASKTTLYMVAEVRESSPEAAAHIHGAQDERRRRQARHLRRVREGICCE